MAESLNITLFKNRALADVTFLFGGHEVKAHKCVLYHRCDYFKQLFDQNNCDKITIDGTSFKIFKEVVNFCYLEQIDLADWSYHEKQRLHELATEYKYGPLMDFVKRELDKRPKVPLSAASLNEWYDNCPNEEIREFVRSNLFNIVNYQDCHKYSNDLVVLIMDTLRELSDKETDQWKRTTQLKKILLWLFRWRNSPTRKDEDVHSLFAKIRLPPLLSDRVLRDETIKKKLCGEVRRFLLMREVDTSGWTCDEVYELGYFAHYYKFDPLFDAVILALATQYLEPAYLEKIHDLTSILHCKKLQQITADYIKNQTLIILNSPEFISYPAGLVSFILENLTGQVMDVNVKNQLLTSLWKWKASKSEDELKAVFTKIQWEDFSRQQLAAVLRIVTPVACLADMSDLPAPAEGKGAKRKQSNNEEYIKCGRPRKE